VLDDEVEVLADAPPPPIVAVEPDVSDPPHARAPSATPTNAKGESDFARKPWTRRLFIG
jgi:hypothetical protein